MLHQLDGAKMSPTYVTAAESGRLSIFGLAAAKLVSYFFLSSHLKMIKCNEARSQQFLIGALLACVYLCVHKIVNVFPPDHFMPS